MPAMHATAVVVLLLVAVPTAVAGQTSVPSADRARRLGLRNADFAVPDSKRAGDLLVEMSALLASPDPVLRDEIAYSAAERWILRERRLDPFELRAVREVWLSNLRDGLGASGDDHVFKRSFFGALPVPGGRVGRRHAVHESGRVRPIPGPNPGLLRAGDAPRPVEEKCLARSSRRRWRRM